MRVTKLYLLLAVVGFALLVYCVVDILTSREDEVRHLPRLLWLAFVVFFPLLGSIAWLAVGRPTAARPRAGERAAPAFPEYDRPGRAAATRGEADDEFLRQVRERAEQQRRAHEAARRERERVAEAERAAERERRRQREDGPARDQDQG